MATAQHLDEQIDELLAVTGRLAALRERSVMLNPFRGYGPAALAADRAFRSIEGFLENRAKALFGQIAADLAGDGHRS